MTQTRIHVRCNAAGKVRREKRDGRDTIVVPSFTLKSGIIMNRIKYEHDEIEASYKGLERTPAPLGHPTINGKFVSASDPEGLVRSFVFAWNENVRREGDRIALDKVIDVERANQSEGGKAVLNAIEKGEPIHTSTGLLCNLVAVKADDHDYLAKSIYWDHDCILLNQEGAATPADGTGIFVNSAGAETPVINSALDHVDQELDWAGMRLLDVLEKRETATLWEKLKVALLGAYAAQDLAETTTPKGKIMAIDPAVEALNAKVDTLANGLKTLTEGLGAQIANAIKPLTDNLTAIQANAQAAAEAEKADLVAKVVKANLLTEPVAKELTTNALKELAAKITAPGTAAALNAAFVPATNAGLGEFAAYDPNAVINDALKEGK